MDLGTPGDEETDVVRKAKIYDHTKVVTLLERFRENPGGNQTLCEA